MGDYDKIYLIPKNISHINHRGDVRLESDFHGLYPIFSAPMKGISGKDLVIEMGKNNCLGILHRFDAHIDRQRNIREIYKENVPFGVAVGLENFDLYELDVAKYAVDHGAILIVLDIANGYLSGIEHVGKKLRETFGNELALMAGNVVTIRGTQFLRDCGFNFVRIGIGSSGVCATREVTGVGRNQLAALKECSWVDVNLVSDGGITIPANATKSFAFNADFCMIGSAFAYAIEAENNGKLFGMASATNHVLNGKAIKSIEGKEFDIDNSKKKPLKEILDQFLWGIRSACTYLDCTSYKEIPHKCEIIKVDEDLI